MEEQNKAGRCGWLALGLMVFLLQGLLPASLIGGVAGLQAAELFESGFDLVNRLLVLTGMIMGLLVSAITIMFLIAAINRLVNTFYVRSMLVLSSVKTGRQD